MCARIHARLERVGVCVYTHASRHRTRPFMVTARHRHIAFHPEPWTLSYKLCISREIYVGSRTSDTV